MTVILIFSYRLLQNICWTQLSSCIGRCWKAFAFFAVSLAIIKAVQLSMTVRRAFITSIFNGEAVRVFKITKKDDGSSSTVQAGFDFSCVSVHARVLPFFLRLSNCARREEHECFEDSV